MLLVAIKGMPGSGKSTLGRALSRRLGWPIIDKDDVKDLIDGHILFGESRVCYTGAALE